MRINKCLACGDKVRVKKLECRSCGISVEGDFYTSPIVGLSEENQVFIELFILSSGSLKEMAQIMDVTYPTVRHRLDEIIEQLKSEMSERGDYKNELLNKVAEGKLNAEQAARIIKSL